MLYLIGLGLSHETDITVRGLETVRKCERVYLEAYTSILMAADKESLEKFYGKEVILADRELVETGADQILKDADKVDVAFWWWVMFSVLQPTSTWSLEPTSSASHTS
ncbi:diphthine synthase [Candidozyma auris]|nr:diphthine synthase [[Candida] auris]